MAGTKSPWIGWTGALLLLLLIGNIASMTWRWGRPYLLGDPLAGFPRVFLWVWERPEDLAFLDPRETGVAVLAKTLTLDGGRISSRPRLQPVRLPAGITAIAVIRIETKSVHPAAEVQKEAVRQILAAVADTRAAGLQIDYDAPASERTFYRSLLMDLRQQLPPGMKLSITALASWCLHDDWISDLPVDEAIPMLFRLGAEDAVVKRHLGAGRDFWAARSRFSIGISTDELPGKVPGTRRVYVFNPRPWTREAVDGVLRYVREMR
jgi:hypothetical protein